MEKINEEKVKEDYKDISQEDVERKFGQAAKNHRKLAAEATDARENQIQSELADECEQKYKALKA